MTATKAEGFGPISKGGREYAYNTDMKLAPIAKAKSAPKKSMGGTSDGHMVANKFMKKAGDKMPKKSSKKGY